jgi:nucleoside-diphosphate-sugar epimerase
MKVLVTGATGFLGRNLVESLHADGASVIATGRSEEVGAELRQLGVEFVPADIQDAARLAEVFSPVDCVVHCAGKSGDHGRYREFHDANVVGTRNVMEACRRHEVPSIIFISSPSLYYMGKDRLGVAESDPLPERQATHYSATKLLAEAELLAFQREGGRVIGLRPRAVYGPHDTTFAPRILRLAKKGKLPLINGGKALVDITYVDNFVDAVRAGLNAEQSAWNEIYNISNGDPIEVREWFARILEVFEQPFRSRNVPEAAAKTLAGILELASHLPFTRKPPAMTRVAVGYTAKSMTLCIDKAREKLGFTPQVSNQEGFERYARWQRAQ